MITIEIIDNVKIETIVKTLLKDEKPYYSKELAQKLKLSNSTI